MYAVQLPSMNVLRTQRGVLSRCASILQKTACCSIQRPQAHGTLQPEACAVQPQARQFGCHRHGSDSSFSRARFVVACANATDSMEGNTVEVELKVEGMKCGGCSSRVEKALKAMDHVKAVQVDLDSKLATVEVEAESLIDAMNMLPEFVTTVKVRT
eukprot:GHUV01023189.1.p1 GENE.GHUV01023189.1~~GHUV01023189.1.p1  ORF type:complete len:157 (+),score=24.89 GHUV01023189.1:116-586(+)